MNKHITIINTITNIAIIIILIIAAAMPTVAAKPGKCAPEMAYIPAGQFMMGCSPGDMECEADEKPSIAVEIDRGFCMDVYEVTQRDYRRYMGDNPSGATLCGGDCPVESVTWYEAVEYCRIMGKRLPTEAEWEYAARGNTKTKYIWSIGLVNDYAWYNTNAMRMPRAVGRKQPNSYGLYDMLGNVWEWTQDCYDEKWYEKNEKPGSILLNDTPECIPHVARGGAWTSYALRVSARKADSYNAEDQGFRCVKDARE